MTYISEIAGPYAWGILHKVVETFPCPSCAAEGKSLMRFAHDLVNVRLGKQPKYPGEARRWVKFAESLAGDRVTHGQDISMRVDFALSDKHPRVGVRSGEDVLGAHSGSDVSGNRGGGSVTLGNRVSLALEMGLAAPFGWPGGKSRLKNQIIAMMPPHKTYVEPFAGAAHVFWAKEPASVEVLNDTDPDLMRFYQNISQAQTCNTVEVAQDWSRLKAKRGNLEPCEFFSVVQCSFGKGMFDRGSALKARDCVAGQPHFHQALPEYQARLRRTKLENQDWEKVVRQYDAPDTFFYLDPPYHGTSRRYFGGDLPSQLPRLAQILPSMKGKWLLSMDDHPDVRTAFKSFNIVPVRTKYSINADSNKQVGKELLISNYQIGVKLNARISLALESKGHLSESAIALDVSGGSGPIRERLRHAQVCDPDSFRTKNQGNHQMVLCCPRGKWNGGKCSTSQIAQARLHPAQEEDTLLREAVARGIPVIDGDSQNYNGGEERMKAQLQEMVGRVLANV